MRPPWSASTGLQPPISGIIAAPARATIGVVTKDRKSAGTSALTIRVVMSRIAAKKTVDSTSSE